MIYVVVVLMGALCASLAGSLVLALALAVELANGEGPRVELRIPEWVGGRREKR